MRLRTTLLSAAISAVGVSAIALTPAPVEPSAAIQRATEMGVTIEYAPTVCDRYFDGQASGCYDPATPDQIAVRTGLGPEWERYVILHELAHAYQDRNGLPLDECDADRIAVRWGATVTGYKCL